MQKPARLFLLEHIYAHAAAMTLRYACCPAVCFLTGCVFWTLLPRRGVYYRRRCCGAGSGCRPLCRAHTAMVAGRRLRGIWQRIASRLSAHTPRRSLSSEGCSLPGVSAARLLTPATPATVPGAAQFKALPQSPVLTDLFGRFHTYLRVSLTERCNLRCTYCMPAEGVALTPKQELLTSEELLRLVDLFVREGVKKVRFTGGEPTMRKDLVQIVQQTGQLRASGLTDIALTTNGIVLTRHLPALVDAGLTSVNISLDTLDPFKFQAITRRAGLEHVLAAIEETLKTSLKLKVNCVVMKGVNEKEIRKFVALTEHREMEVRFIEYMPFDGNQWTDRKFYSFRQMLRDIELQYSLSPCASPSPHETAKTFQVNGFQGKVGFITSMSENFCGSCNRLRLTADGNLKVCLFGATEVNLRDVLRAGATADELRSMIKSAVKKKKKEHQGMHNIVKTPNRPMISIGG
eukprot:g53044.t1